jgi:GT2 family glycosyltransferase
MDVSVIIVNYNTLILLCDAIESILSNTESLNYEIIVVDNASNDNSENIIAEKYGEKVLYIPLSENVGFGRANNEGIKASKGRNIFLLNPDTVLLNNAVKILSDYLDENPETGIAGGNLFDVNKAPAYSYRFFFPSLFWEINDMFLAYPEKLIFGKNACFNSSSQPLVVAYITGADMMISRKAFDKAGRFDPDFFLYFEESDLAFRVRKSGFLIKSVPQAEIIHLEGNSFATPVSRRIHYFNGKLIYYRKNASRFKLSLLILIMHITFYSRIFVFSILLNRSKVRYWRSEYHAYLTAKSESI